MKYFQIAGASVLALLFSACTTTPPSTQTTTTQTSTTDQGQAPITGQPSTQSTGEAVISPPAGSSTTPSSPPPTPYYPDPSSGQSSSTINVSQAYQSVNGWASADFTNALISFKRGCVEIMKKDSGKALHNSRSEFGRISDWASACNQAQFISAGDSQSARSFFESEFLPVNLPSSGAPEGLVTGYYQPEIQARRIKTSIYSEPILSTPTNAANLTLPRSRITENTSTVIAYGKPIDVFFMQIQGSGVLALETGERVRAAYDGNNGRPYTSIGRVLVDRGAFTLEQASKQSIEDWMDRAGPEAARALMNENTRYIFFKEETIFPGEGPKGAMRVPLTDMASIAVDPSHYPYGIPVWLETKLPSVKGDYRGADQQLLAIAQDTGKAIRGPFRADLYFGSGDQAGDLAGIMKHSARWTVLLPFHLALQWIPVS